MKKILMTFVLGMFLLSLGFAAAADQNMLADGTGEFHNEMIAAGGQNGTMVQGEGMRVMAMAGTYQNLDNQEMKIERVQERIQIHSGEQFANCSDSCNLTQEQVQNQTRLYTKLSNGQNAEIKIMPDTASEKALEMLELKNCENCSIELKEIGNGDEARMAYEVKTQKRARFLGIIGTNMNVEAQVDAETGEIIRTKKAWWSFLASEPTETLE